MANTWKRAFFLLLSFNLGLIILLTILVFWPRPQPPLLDRQPASPGDYLDMDLVLSSKDLEGILDRWGQDRGLPIDFSLDSQFALAYSLEFMGQETVATLRGTPQVGEDGRLAIGLEEVRLGNLPIPNQVALGLLAGFLPQDGPLYLGDQTLWVDPGALSKDYRVRVKSFSEESQAYGFGIQVDRKNIFK